MNEYLQVGKIVNTHGIRGEVKVIPLTDDPRRYDDLKEVFVGTDNKKDIFNIENVKYFKNTVIIKFKESVDMNYAEKLKEMFIYVDRKNAVKLPEGRYFICDLIDLEVFELDGNRLGVLKDVIQTGSNDVYVVKTAENKEILIPALKSVIKEVSIEDRFMKVELPDGLLDIYR
ncbi:MAG TPA: ribosome maturation factor RimM [Pseudobacteroides sp.]|uniref:ribosome maturation factor RimM n=1 Tax=Pseudobacteroides sp. TaxID=1968840 RepID=UPI002F92AA40